MGLFSSFPAANLKINANDDPLVEASSPAMTKVEAAVKALVGYLSIAGNLFGIYRARSVRTLASKPRSQVADEERTSSAEVQAPRFFSFQQMSSYGANVSSQFLKRPLQHLNGVEMNNGRITGQVCKSFAVHVHSDCDKLNSRGWSCSEKKDEKD
jgi:hypothetical protein